MDYNNQANNIGYWINIRCLTFSAKQGRNIAASASVKQYSSSFNVLKSSGRNSSTYSYPEQMKFHQYCK